MSLRGVPILFGTTKQSSHSEIASPEPALSEKDEILRFAQNDRSEGARNHNVTVLNAIVLVFDEKKPPWYQSL
ncbi:MAG: hypothetical protein Q8N09_10605 [Thermodesulfovibrionia bacterium]|nr:hypothetical protein [Thermodesulfovibrionia bacterium]